MSKASNVSESTYPSAPSRAAIEHAADVLAAGHLAAFPTETVYGLGADAENPEAVARIYTAKRRPANHPVIVHIAPDGDLAYWASEVPSAARRLIDAFWPGPLTLILKRRPGVGQAVSGGQDSIGVRCPAHPVAQALLRAFATRKASGQGGVAAPSANTFGHVSPTRADHVRTEFPNEVAAGMPVLDGGAAQVGIESTIVDLSRLDQGIGAVLLRPGHISAADIAQVLGEPIGNADAAAPRASGTLKAHYAPRTPLALIDNTTWPDLARLAARRTDERIAVVTHGEPLSNASDLANLDWHAVPTDPARYAQTLYALLRDLDQQGYDRIWLQAPPIGSEWDAVNDRIRRAAAAFSLDR